MGAFDTYFNSGPKMITDRKYWMEDDEIYLIVPQDRKWRYHLFSPYEAVEIIKELPGGSRWWNKDGKYWVIVWAAVFDLTVELSRVFEVNIIDNANNNEEINPVEFLYDLKDLMAKNAIRPRVQEKDY